VDGSILRSDDITKDPRYGRNDPHFGMPKGHLPVKSYLAVPVTSRSGAVIGALFFGHAEPCVFTEASERVIVGLAGQAAIATDNARLFQAAQQLNTSLEAEVEKRTRERDRIWNVSQDLLLVADTEGRFLAVNPAWTTVLGWSEADLLSKASTWLEHPDDYGRTREEIARLAKGNRTVRFENRFRHRDGTYRWLSWRAVPEEGMVYCVVRDVTADKVAQAELETAQEALRQAQKMEAVGQLTGGIAHDFNNLLTGIVGSLDLLLMRLAQGRTGDLERYANAAIGSANRAAALTHRLLAFARRQPLDPRPVNANALVASMDDLLRRTLGEAITLELVTAGGLWTTLCDPNQLESAILNLAINARDAMPTGGKLTIETANAHLDSLCAAAQRDLELGQYVAICVTDTGVGMTPEVIARAFDPFFTTKPLGQGTGLGLSMVYGFAKQSEGHVRIYSEVGAGTTVKIYLPRHRDAAGEAPASSDTPEPHQTETGETVLVVEDDPVVRNLTIEVLRDSGYRTLEAIDGPAGLKILQSHRPIDLLVTDVGLPGLNGRQLADRARVTRPDLKVLFITGYAESAAAASGFLGPGMALMTKPFAFDALARRIREMIQEA
jgi:PAS domain S-box-containing protein